MDKINPLYLLAVLGGVVAVTIGYFVLSIYFALHGGSPWGRYFFRAEVREYLAEKYPELEYEIVSTGYSFKEGTYRVSVAPSSGDVTFRVGEYYSGLEDNYPYILWENEVSERCQQLLEQNEVQARCNFYLNGMSGIEGLRLPFPSYDEIKGEYTDKKFNKIEIDFMREIKPDTDLDTLLEIMNRLLKERYSNDIRFWFKDVYFSLNPADQVDTKEKLMEIMNRGM